MSGARTLLGELAFRAGPVQGAPPLRFTPAPVTVLVGPNNCGKTIALQELENRLQNPEAAIVDRMFENVLPVGLELEEVRREFARSAWRTDDNTYIFPGSLRGMLQPQPHVMHADSRWATTGFRMREQRNRSEPCSS